MMSKKEIVELIESIVPQQKYVEKLVFSKEDGGQVVEYLISRRMQKDSRIADKSSLRNDLGLDSLEVFEIAYELEHLYAPLIEHKKIPAKVMENWKTVRDIKDYIKNL